MGQKNQSKKEITHLREKAWSKCHKTFFSFKLINGTNKLGCLSLAGLSSLVYRLLVRQGAYRRKVPMKGVQHG